MSNYCSHTWVIIARWSDKIKKKLINKKFKKLSKKILLFLILPLFIGLLILNIERENQKYFKLLENYDGLMSSLNTHRIKSIKIFRDYDKRVNKLAKEIFQLDQDNNLIIENNKDILIQKLIQSFKLTNSYYSKIDEFILQENDFNIIISSYINRIKIYSNSNMTTLENDITKTDKKLEKTIKQIIDIALEKLEFNIKFLKFLSAEKVDYSLISVKLKKLNKDFSNFNNDIKIKEKELNKIFITFNNIYYTKIHNKLNENYIFKIFDFFCIKPKKLDFSSNRLYNSSLLNHNSMRIIPDKSKNNKNINYKNNK